LSFLESEHFGGPSHTSFSLTQLPSSTTPSLATPSSIAISFTTPFMIPFVALIVFFLVVHFDLPSNATPLFPTYAHPSLSGSSLHVASPTSSKKVINSSVCLM
jgi:hypothetical protein